MKTLNELKVFLENNVLYHRFNLEDLSEMVSDFLSFNITFIPLETIGELDQRVGINLLLEDKVLYVDIYYLRDRFTNMFITEIGFDNDNVLNVVDYDKKIKGGY